jgi:hypothetical protein
MGMIMRIGERVVASGERELPCSLAVSDQRISDQRISE